MIYRYLIFILLALQSAYSAAVCIPNGGDGVLDIESCAEADITLSIPALARVNQLQEFSLGEFDYVTVPQSLNDFCIWYNTEEFSLTVNSANSTGDSSFGLLGTSSAARIPYEVVWYDQTGGSGTELNLTSLEDVPQQQLRLPSQPVNSDCEDNNTSINVRVPLQNLENQPEDSYSDTLTVTVSVQ
ncbi:hypothetical protein GZ77_18875 [Endozoicomonas montiporae]|uniref:Spore coat protein U domain-containing protein n=2 Tax=Endozoicomonas montiporae TaxID=1027273 RepID=A0A081N2A0_9GAMM|nr:hypothetical protein [Endozoicomonas montiporae]AMO58467.1 hypothetical protein EZMO1_4555 [Endozoicomonas montiporae CL-33]KEQ12573.1 hypothetical protein GZ77_18875 [Endozoicomonas montiporae]